MTLKFSKLSDSRVEEAFNVLQLVARSLEARGRKQRISKTSLAAYTSWQTERANYVATEADEIVSVVTLRRQSLEPWTGFLGLGPNWVLRALATHPDWQGNEIGAFAVREALRLYDNRGPIFLDCVSEFLPAYYQQLGFQPIGRQDYRDADGDTYDITLMRYDNLAPVSKGV